jgi:hypothetical protein
MSTGGCIGVMSGLEAACWTGTDAAACVRAYSLVLGTGGASADSGGRDFSSFTGDSGVIGTSGRVGAGDTEVWRIVPGRGISCGAGLADATSRGVKSTGFDTA